MRRWLLLVLAGVMLAGCGAPTAPVALAPTQTPYVIVVTATPVPATPTPDVLVPALATLMRYCTDSAADLRADTARAQNDLLAEGVQVDQLRILRGAVGEAEGLPQSMLPMTGCWPVFQQTELTIGASVARQP